MRQEHAPDGTPRGFGVRFSTVDAETKQALEQILEAHQQPTPPAPLDTAQFETQLAEARGTIEASEEMLAIFRENEANALQKLEDSLAECGVLMRLSHELQAQVHRYCVGAQVDTPAPTMSRPGVTSTRTGGIVGSGRVGSSPRRSTFQMSEPMKMKKAPPKNLMAQPPTLLMVGNE